LCGRRPSTRRSIFIAAGAADVTAETHDDELSGYIFARHRFPGKEVLYLQILGLLMIPGILTLIPAFVLTHQLGIWNTPWR
jgi:ABC-type glycerol-3-phosphate transport system permease component